MKIDTNEVFIKYADSMRSFVASKISNVEDAEDIFQDILIKIHKNLDEVKSVESIKPWVFSVARNSIIDFYRKKSRNKNEIFDENLFLFEETKENLSELSHCLEPFISALPAESKDILTGIVLDGLSQKEFAELSKINYSTLKSKAQRARLQLLEVFQDCCTFQFDKNGNAIDFIPKKKTCSTCKK